MTTFSDPDAMGLFYDYQADVKAEKWHHNDYAGWLENRVIVLEAQVKKLQEQIDGNTDADPRPVG